MQTSMRRRIASVALAVLVAFGCGALTALAQETAEGQTAYAAQQGTWKKSSGKWWYAYNGEEYHHTKDSESLKRSTAIHSGTIAQSGKPRVCSNCG